MKIDIIIQIILIIGCIYSCYTDVKYTKIKNYITFPLMIIGLVYNAIWGNFTYSLIGLFIPLLFLFLGQGDVKLFMGIGTILGYKAVLDIILLSLVLSMLFSVFNKSFFISIKNLYYKLICIILFKTGDMKTLTEVDKSNTHKVKMAIPICLSVILKITYISENYVWNFVSINWQVIVYLLIVVLIFFSVKIRKTITNSIKK